jgi:hypothetical protein
MLATLSRLSERPCSRAARKPEAVFLPHMIGTDGRTLLEHASEILPPAQDKVVQLGAPR